MAAGDGFDELWWTQRTFPSCVPQTASVSPNKHLSAMLLLNFQVGLLTRQRYGWDYRVLTNWWRGFGGLYFLLQCKKRTPLQSLITWWSLSSMIVVFIKSSTCSWVEAGRTHGRKAIASVQKRQVYQNSISKKANFSCIKCFSGMTSQLIDCGCSVSYTPGDLIKSAAIPFCSCVLVGFNWKSVCKKWEGELESS